MRLLILGFGLLLVTIMFGCAKKNEITPSASKEYEPPRLSKRDCDIIEHVVRTTNEHYVRKRCYLTPTPMKVWETNGKWKNMPKEIHSRLADSEIEFRHASELKMENGNAVDKKSKEPEWLKWVTIVQWISETEVEVEVGDHCNGMFGSSVRLYAKVDGNWVMKSRNNEAVIPSGKGPPASSSSKNPEAIELVHEAMRVHSYKWELEMDAADNGKAAADACSKLIVVLNEVDTSSCPQDYQKQYAVLIASLSDIRDILSEIDKKRELGERLSEAIRKCKDEGSRLNKIAESYGLKIEALKDNQ